MTLALGLLVPTAARAFTPEPWTRTDSLWELAYASVVAMDCTQSMQITPSGRYERNPVLPKHPSPTRSSSSARPASWAMWPFPTVCP
ncbi:MAG: hypothetical protein ABSH53_01255 [Holophaga sp.]